METLISLLSCTLSKSINKLPLNCTYILWRMLTLVNQHVTLCRHVLIAEVKLHTCLFPKMQITKPSQFEIMFCFHSQLCLPAFPPHSYPIHGQRSKASNKAGSVCSNNHHPGIVLSGSWRPNHRLPHAFLITLITLLIPVVAWLLIPSWETAGGK